MNIGNPKHGPEMASPMEPMQPGAKSGSKNLSKRVDSKGSKSPQIGRRGGKSPQIGRRGGKSSGRY